MRFLSPVLFAALAASLLPSCTPSPQERMARADKALAEHRYSHARPDFEALLQDDPANARVQLALARIHVANDDPLAALAVLDAMAQGGSAPREASLLRGEAKLMLGRFDDAMAVVAGDGSAEAWRIRAIAHTGRNEPDQVLVAFENGARAPGAKARLLADYAHFRLGQGDLEAARKLARQAVRDEPDNLAALMVSGDIALAERRLRPALGWYARASRLYPESRRAMVARIAMLTELGQFARAGALVAEARIAAPLDTDLLYFDALLAAKAKDWAKARDLLQPYETSLESMPLANALYAEALLRLGQEDQARVRLASHLLREPENWQVRLLLGEARLASDDAEGALEALAPVAEWADASAKARALLAEAEARASGG
jgi:predicted Zn-dependent protease